MEKQNEAFKDTLELKEFVQSYYVSNVTEIQLDMTCINQLLSHYGGIYPKEHLYLNEGLMTYILENVTFTTNSNDLLNKRLFEKIVLEYLLIDDSKKLDAKKLVYFIFLHSKVIVVNETDELMFYNQHTGCYDKDENILKRLLYVICDILDIKPSTPQMLNQVREGIKSKSSVINQNSIGQGSFSLANRTVVFNDTTCQVEQHHPKYFSVYGNHTLYYDRNKDCPRFKNFLNETFLSDIDTIRFVQCWFGYNLIDSVSAQKFLICIGDGANGKSVLFSLLRHMLSSKNTAATSMTNLSHQFGRESLVGKRANISNENSSDWFDADILKEISSGEVVTIDRKFEKSITVKLYSKLTFLCNELPIINDQSYGYERRLIVLPFKKILLPEEQNPYLEDMLKDELTGILNWSLEGLQMLMDNQFQFKESDAMIESKKIYLSHSNPMSMFIDERIVKDFEGRCYKNDVFKSYIDWLRDKGLSDKNASSTNMFWKSFEKEFYKTHHISLKGSYSKSAAKGRYFVGYILLNNDGTVGKAGK